MQTLSRKDILLLVMLTLFWGFNWPVMKFGVTDLPPVTFRALCILCSLPVMWFVATRMNDSIAISKAQIMPLIRLSLPNVLLCQILMITGVKMLSSGRAAILTYTMPVWAFIFACIIFRERPNRTTLLGIICAAAAAFLLLSGEFSALSGQAMGIAIVLGAAAFWGFGTVQLKHRQIPLPTSSLTFWMFLFGVTGMAAYAFMFEYSGWRLPRSWEWGAIFYNAVFVFGMGSIIWNNMARTLPPTASSLSTMMVPVVGVFSGSFFLSETPGWQDFLAILLIMVSIGTVLLRPGKAKKQDSSERLQKQSD